MVHIQRRPFANHLRADPVQWVRHQRRGAVVHEGAGLAFWFRPLTAALSEVPIDDRELAVLFHLRTRDFQLATVQGTVTYRITDPGVAATRLDFGIDPSSGRRRATPLDQLASLLTESAQQHAVDTLAGLDLTDALTRGLTEVRERVTAGLSEDTRISDTGVTVIGVRVTSIRPDGDLERALQAPARERVQQAADAAGFERRALAVERERAIAENELQSQIELARREEQLVERNGLNERRRAEEAAAAARIQAEAQAERDRLAAAATAESRRVIGAAEAESHAAHVAAYSRADPAVLIALAVQQLAEHLPNIGTVNITPDLLGAALAKLTEGRPSGSDVSGPDAPDAPDPDAPIRQSA
ncbi:SPFH domain-containing protein [Yinghuangia sp. ASG 101]|uniref:SPFH domain-containing protein n=1 Tax=Yinghuangia sp. ASG 101 TaxID=2896848 RepID=UPI001E5356C0|nr:SPFH domain-containing protein [Yinghuangia sp. ASG 101]UGQ13655.1 SPFH domain-containing protein [Yinghuangia sp. ASG 101]